MIPRPIWDEFFHEQTGTLDGERMAAEIVRLRAAVARVRAVDRFDLAMGSEQTGEYSIDGPEGFYMYADEVLAALEATP